MGKNILIGCLFFKNLTGSEIYYYEVAKVLVDRGYHVTIAASVVGDGKLLELVKEEGYDSDLKIIQINTLTQQVLKGISVIIASHYPIIKALCQMKEAFKLKCKFISINHHEFYPLEAPFISPMIDKYIGIRPAICERLKKCGVENPTLIWNPLDFGRFPIEDKKEFNPDRNNTILYCGTTDYVRKESIYNMAKECSEKGWKLVLVGDNNGDYLPELLAQYSCVEYHESTNDIEDYIDNANATAGVFLGRTTIEGWLRGVPGFVYLLDKDYHVVSRSLEERPDDYEKFNEENVVTEILNCVK